MENSELEDLDQLVNSAGWQRFRDHVNAEWGRNSETYHDAIEKAASGDNVHLQDHLRQILAAQREILKVMRWATDRIGYLKRVDHRVQEPVLSRRGSL